MNAELLRWEAESSNLKDKAMMQAKGLVWRERPCSNFYSNRANC